MLRAEKPPLPQVAVREHRQHPAVEPIGLAHSPYQISGYVLRMNPYRLPLFCDTAMAERIERVEAELIASASEAADRRRTDPAGFVIRIAGGVATFAEEGSPFNKVAGLGFAGVPTAAALDEIERA